MGVAFRLNHSQYSNVSNIIASALAVFVVFFVSHVMNCIIFEKYRLLGNKNMY